jgi:hypothetical protein
MVAVVDQLERLTMQDDLLLLYLPMAHNFGRLMHLAGPYVGFTIAFLPGPLRTAEALLKVRPTVLPSVPRVYEKVHAGVLAKFDEETGLKRSIVDWALRVGYRVSSARQRGARVPTGLELQRRLAHKLVYSKVQARLGGRLRIAISGGAPLARDIAEFFDASESRSSRATASPSAPRRRPSTASRSTARAPSALRFRVPSYDWATTASSSSGARPSLRATSKRTRRRARCWTTTAG